MTGYSPGDLREWVSLTVAIDHEAGLRDLHEAMGDIRTAAQHLEAGLALYKARSRLERAVTKCEVARAVEKLWPAEWVS